MGLHENMRSDPISELSLRSPVLMNAGDSIAQAVQGLREANLGCVVIVDDDRRPIGIFTEAMLRHQMTVSSDVLSRTLGVEMATSFPWARLTDPIELIVDAMEAKNARFVVAVDEEGRVAGLTGQKGLMEYIAEHFPGEVMVQRVGTEAYPEHREGA